MNPTTKGLLDILLRGKWGQVYDLIDAFKGRDPDVIAKELGEALEAFDQPEYAAPLKKLAVALAGGAANWAKIGQEWSAIQGLIFAEFVKEGAPLPSAPTIRVMGNSEVAARKHVRDMTDEDFAAWWRENKTQVREGVSSWWGQRAMRKCPEMLAMLEGKMTAEEIKALDPDQVVKWLTRAVFALTVGAVFWPPLGLAASALEFFLEKYKAKHPDIPAAMALLAS
jgi:hypothetical protein